MADAGYTSYMMDDYLIKAKQLPLLSHNFIRRMIEINGNSGYLYINDFLKLNNLYYFLETGERLLSFEDMLKFDKTNTFTYILFQVTHSETGKTSFEFRARPIYSQMESFSKHQTIYLLTAFELFGIDAAIDTYSKIKRVNPPHENLGVVLAGEISFRTKTYFDFNFSSGTYMLERFKDYRKYDIDEKMAMEYAIMFIDIIKNYVYNDGNIRLQYNSDAGKSILTNNDIAKDLKYVWSKIKEVEIIERGITVIKPIRIYLLQSSEDFLIVKNIDKIIANFITSVNTKIRGLSLLNSDLRKEGIKIKDIFDFNDEKTQYVLNKYDILNSLYDNDKKKYVTDPYETYRKNASDDESKIFNRYEDDINLNRLASRQYYDMIIRADTILKNTSNMITSQDIDKEYSKTENSRGGMLVKRNTRMNVKKYVNNKRKNKKSKKLTRKKR